jgi:hypothetical protein
MPKKTNNNKQKNKKIQPIQKSQKPLRKKKTKSTLRNRIPYDAIIKGEGGELIKNPFKKKVTIRGDDIKELTIFFDDIHHQISLFLQEEIYKIYGQNNIYIFGCIAWFSDKEIISTLSMAAGVQLILNDEKFSAYGGGKVHETFGSLPRIQVKYNVMFKNCEVDLLAKLKPKQTREIIDLTGHPYFQPNNTRLKSISKNRTFRTENGHYASIRVIGTRPIEEENKPEEQETGKSYFQQGEILHSKYFVPCYWKGPGTILKPLGVISGSANATQKSRLNQENMMWVKSEKSGVAYLTDYIRTFLASENLRS